MILVFDCEIIKMIPAKKGREQGFEYCQGWQDFKGMGISVIAVCDLDSLFEEVFVFPEVSEIKQLIPVAEFWGFNSKNFDDRLCQAHGLPISSKFDLLEEIRLSAYGSADWRDQPAGFSYSLEAIARANGLAKSGSGELAPKLWQQGSVKEVVDYCLQDARITRQLILKFLDEQLRDPNTGAFLLPKK